MTNEPLLHLSVSQRVEELRQRPPHALLLIGPTGIGKQTVANWIAAQLLTIDIGKLGTHPNVLQVIAEAGKALSINDVRQLEHVLALKTTSTAAVNRVILVHDAHTMTEEAQNAILKTLEEPPAGTVIIMTSAQREALLPTVRSRVQTIEIIRPPKDQLLTALQEQGTDPVEANRLLALSDSLPGLTFAMAASDTTHPLVAAVETARTLLQASLFARLQQVDALAKDRPATAQVIDMLQHMAHAALQRPAAAERWQHVMRAAYDASVSLQNGAQPKLALTSLMLNL